jgi:GMP synthase (glutamine-hydrolysing)
MVSKILVIVHQQNSDPGCVGQILRANGYELDIRCPSNADELPTTMDNHEGVVIFGGPMSANDSETLPFIRAELDWIPVALEADKPFLGICLGAQLLARVLGAKVSASSPGNDGNWLFSDRACPRSLSVFRSSSVCLSMAS